MGTWIPSALFTFILHSRSGVLTIPQLLHGTIALDKLASKACYILPSPHPQVDYNMVVESHIQQRFKCDQDGRWWQMVAQTGFSLSHTTMSLMARSHHLLLQHDHFRLDDLIDSFLIKTFTGILERLSCAILIFSVSPEIPSPPSMLKSHVPAFAKKQEPRTEMFVVCSTSLEEFWLSYSPWTT